MKARNKRKRNHANGPHGLCESPKPHGRTDSQTCLSTVKLRLEISKNIKLKR
ncbi:MAG: hypothetical protein QW577_01120 [Candidatus Bathyarchaeia archaeon]